MIVVDIWKMKKWEAYYLGCYHRSGLRVDYEKTVDPNVKRACKEFVSWLRSKYEFPMRIRMYVKDKKQIRAQDGSMVYGTCFLPYDRSEEPYIRIAAGYYQEQAEKRGIDNALASILWNIAHELSHYFQWLNNLELTPMGEERQATNYANRILDEYAETRDHP